MQPQMQIFLRMKRYGWIVNMRIMQGASSGVHSFLSKPTSQTCCVCVVRLVCVA